MSIDADTVPILLVHGWAGSAESWAPVSELLSARPAFGPVIAVRLPGSPGAATNGTRTIPGAAELLTETLRGLDRPALLIGHSMGAQITLLAQAAAADSILGEIVVDPAYGSDASAPAMETWAQEIESVGHDALTEFFDSAIGSRLSDRDAARVRADLLQTTPADLAGYLRSEYVDENAVGLLERTIDAASRRTRPVLALHSSPQGAAVESALPAPQGSQVSTWRGHGHFLHLEAPERFTNSVADWAGRLALSTRS